MKHGIQKQIAEATELSAPMISLILCGKKRPSWSSAKRLAAATDTDPVLWLEGSPNEIKNAISQESDALMKQLKHWKQEPLCNVLNVPCDGEMEEA